jgi:hypothetical protein
MRQRTLLPDGGEVVLNQLQVQSRDRILMVLRRQERPTVVLFASGDLTGFTVGITVG